MTNQPEKPKIGISSCLLGNKVRYDGEHKFNANIIAALGLYFDFVPFCPEAETGMGVPRKPIHLVRRGNKIHALEVDKHANNFTQQLENYCLVNKHKISEISGFILKARSPSCGVQNVQVFQENEAAGIVEHMGEGIFARMLKKQFPLMPLEEEGRLADPVVLNNFIEQVFSNTGTVIHE